MADRKLIVKIVGDSSSLERAFKRANKAAVGFGGRMKGLAKDAGMWAAAATVAATGFAIAIGVKSVKAAMSLTESLRRVNTVFGDSAVSVRKWGITAATTMGLTEDQALAAAGSFGLLLRNMDFAPRKAADMSKSMVQLAVDMAVFNKASPGDTLKALQRGLTGMMRGLKQYGIVISNAQVKTEALRETGRKNAQDLTNAELTQARYNLILQQSSLVTGTFHRQSSRLSTVFHIIGAEVKNLEEQFGIGLLPVVRKVANMLQNRLADPKVRQFIRHLGFEIGTTLLNTFISLHAWFIQNWPRIVNGFHNATRIARSVAKAVGQIADALERTYKHAKQLYDLGQKVTGGKLGKVLGVSGIDLVHGAKKGAGKFAKFPTLIPHASGGTVSAGQGYLVGEQGPEAFFPGRGGTIVPNGGPAGGGDLTIVLELDGMQVGRAFIPHFQRAGKNLAGQTRGRHGGSKLAFG